MRRILSQTSLLSALLLAAVGCGGHHHRSANDSSDPERTSLTFTASDDYNGANTDLVGTSTASQAITALILTLEDGERRLQVSVPYPSIAQGATITPSTANANFEYRESPSTADRSWIATSGSVTITKLTDTQATVTVNGLQFSPTPNSGNTATGTFTADGKIVGISLVSQM